MSERDLQRWSREVAEDPGAPAFVRLARAYRRQGRRAAAHEVVLRGLERNPEHLEAHSLLAVIHLEDGDREQARDEWETVLRLAPDNFDANRGLGFLALERNDLARARRHLDAAARVRPDDPTAAQALEVARRRAATGEPASPHAPVAFPPASDRSVGPPIPTTSGARGDGAAQQPPVDAPGRRDPTRLFDALTDDDPFLGALVLDEQGLVLAGSLVEGRPGAGELLGAVLNDVVDEAHRTAQLVRIGEWHGLLADSEHATVHVAPLGADAIVVVVARPGTPAGWVMRIAARAHLVASRFMEVAP